MSVASSPASYLFEVGRGELAHLLTVKLGEVIEYDAVDVAECERNRTAGIRYMFHESGVSMQSKCTRQTFPLHPDQNKKIMLPQGGHDTLP